MSLQHDPNVPEEEAPSPSPSASSSRTTATSTDYETTLCKSPPASSSSYYCICVACDESDTESDSCTSDEEDTRSRCGSEQEDDEHIDNFLDGDDSINGDSSMDDDDFMGEDGSEYGIVDKKTDESRQTVQTLRKCWSLVRRRAHAEQVTTLLLNCPEIVTLIVGPSKNTLTCHKALLGFYSAFFDAALYGNFKEGQSGTVELPGETPEEIAALIPWLYSGLLESKINAVKLWILGDLLRMPVFCNEVMHLLMNTYGTNIKDGGQWLSASTVRYVYTQTNVHSVLRHFVRDMLRVEGPLCARALKDNAGNESYADEWNDLIYSGGDLVLDVASVSSFSNDRFSDDTEYPGAPYMPQNQHRYLMWVRGTRPIEDFVNGVRR